MLPFDRRPWAKSLARFVILVSLLAAVSAAYVLYSLQELHIPEMLIILLLLLTIVPPNVAIVLRKQESDDTTAALPGQLHTR